MGIKLGIIFYISALLLCTCAQDDYYGGNQWDNPRDSYPNHNRRNNPVYGQYPSYDDPGYPAPDSNPVYDPIYNPGLPSYPSNMRPSNNYPYDPNRNRDNIPNRGRDTRFDQRPSYPDYPSSNRNNMNNRNDGGLIVSGLSFDDPMLITAKHNELRLMVARGKLKSHPRATNLKRMRWDSNLAALAQDQADRKIKATQRVNDKRWFAVGQNLYVSSISVQNCASNWEKAIATWFHKSTEYEFGSDKYNHFTQIIWANTTHVGCGFSCFNEDIWTTQLYVCNYGPPGNIQGEQPYHTAGHGCDNLCDDDY